MKPNPETKIDHPTEPTLLQAAGSAAAGLFGVQSAKNRERDFKASSPVKFIFMGAVMTCVFITLILLVVRQLLQHQGGSGL